MAEKLLTKMDTKQKIIAGLLVAVLIVISWQIFGMFSTEKEVREPSKEIAQIVDKPQQMQQVIEPPIVEKPLDMQAQESQQKYLDAVNQLQMLRIKASIAETNKRIAADKLEIANSERKIAELDGSNLSTPTVMSNFPKQEATVEPTVIKGTYTVVSVIQTNNTWSAVLRYKGSLYNVKIGEVLTADGSKVVAIFKNGVTLEKENARKKLQLASVL